MTTYYTAPVNVEFEARVKRMLVERADNITKFQPGYWSDIESEAKRYSAARRTVDAFRKGMKFLITKG